MKNLEFRIWNLEFTKRNSKFISSAIYHQFIVIIIVTITILITAPLRAAAIRGQALDAMTGNPVENASVVIGDGDIGTATDLAGRFNLSGLDEGQIWILTVSHIAYQTLETKVSVGEAPIVLKLTPVERRLAQVVVTAGRLNSAEAGGSITDIDRRTVELNYAVQDIPLLVVGQTPGATAFSWSGSAVGAQNLRIRGFDTDRLSVTVEGVPMNDPGEHTVYFQDTPDFLSSAYDLQVERGVSSLRAGPAGLGGGLNISTGDVVAKPALDLTYQAGSFNTERRTVLFRSGLVDERYNITSRFSRVTTDGYRDHTGADLWAYFLAATRYDSKMVTRLQTWGGQEEMDAYWWGIDKNTLQQNRRANYSAWNKAYHAQFFGDDSVNYTGERDWFQQPHYVLRNQWRLRNDLELDQSLFYIHGFGFYEEYKVNRKFSVYNLPVVIRDRDGDGVQDTIRRSDLVHRKNVTKDQIGWLPRLVWTQDAGKVELGLELRRFTGEHWGTVVWVKELAGGAPPAHEWYRWRAAKYYLGGFVNCQRRLNPQFKIDAGLQVRSIHYPWEREPLGAFACYNFDIDYLFFNPRLGLTYKLDDRTSLYAAFSGAEREPNEELIFNADNPYDIPKSKKYGHFEIEPERVWDVEIGGRRAFRDFDITGNIYAMFFRNEIIPTGHFDVNSGEAIMTNAPTSKRLGLELDVVYRPPIPGLSLKGNLALGRAALGDYKFHYTAYDADWNLVADTTLNLSGHRIALFPEIVANLQADWAYKPFTLSLQMQHIGEQFMDNREDDDAKLAGYTLLNGILRWSVIKAESGRIGLDLELRGMNLTDKLYEPYGVVDVEYGTPYYIPACGRQWFGGITLKL
ncbi:MAG: TonB-dependent receptor [Calditrichaeota bacterium]|nr:TonB-dependent receptor [Calditrichota bacterium]